MNSYEKGRHLHRDLRVSFPPIPYLAVITGDRAAFFPVKHKPQKAEKNAGPLARYFILQL